MATRTTVSITDDIDGSDNAETVTFSFDGVTYEVDLGDKNRRKLEEILDPFIGAGRRVRGTARRSPARTQATRASSVAIREWAKEQGLQVSDRGRISSEVTAQYEASH